MVPPATVPDMAASTRAPDRALGNAAKNLCSLKHRTSAAMSRCMGLSLRLCREEVLVIMVGGVVSME